MEVGIAPARDMLARTSEPQLRPFPVKMMRSNDCFRAGLRLFVAVLGMLLSVDAGLAASVVVRDGNTIQLGDATFKLDGLDAPEFDQICIDDHADPWTCGIEARDQLTKLIGGRSVRCDDVGPEKNFGKRHRAICTAEGDKVSLNEQLVKLGFAIAREPIKANVKPAAADAKSTSTGIWKGCFVAPQEFRTGKKDGALR